MSSLTDNGRQGSQLCTLQRSRCQVGPYRTCTLRIEMMQRGSYRHSGAQRTRLAGGAR
jgi:hypothetical protein